MNETQNQEETKKQPTKTPFKEHQSSELTTYQKWLRENRRMSLNYTDD